jgi:hypothetical protein
MSLMSNNHTIIHNVTGVMKFDFNDWLSEEDFKYYLEKINPKDNVKFYFPNDDWCFFLIKRKKSTITTIDKLLLSGKYLDEELRDIILQIRYSPFLNEDNNLYSEIAFAKNYKTWHRYFERVKKLKSYFDKNLKEYYKYNKYIG